MDADGPFAAVTMGRSDDLMIDEPVIAVGNPVNRVKENVKLLLDAVIDRMNLGFKPVTTDGHVEVLADSPAARIKLAPGDRITAIGRFRVESPENLVAILQQARTGATVDIEVVRNRRAMTGSIKLQ